MQLTNAGDVRSWFLLAMCQWRLDQLRRSRQLLQHAQRRIPYDAGALEYLAELRHEATELIGQPDTSSAGFLTESQDDPAAYTLLLEIQPGAQWLYRLRVDACLPLKLWDQVIADIPLRIQADRNNPHLWYCEAVARLGAGDVAGYRAVRKGILAQFRDTKDTWVASHLSHACAAVPSEPEEAEALLRLAEFGVSGTPGNPRVRGAMNYRAGKYHAAIADFDQSAPVSPRRAWDWLFVAMAHYKLGHIDEAKKSLKKAEDWIQRADRLRARGSNDPWLAWFEPLEVAQILKEARAAIR